MFRTVMSATCFAALLAASPAWSQTFPVREDRIVDTVLGDGLGATAGAWRARMQVIFDPKSQQLERRMYEVFDHAAAPGLEFSWAADDLATDRPGKISGAGRLLWREADKPAYDESGIVSAYRGTMRNGHAEGQGRYATREGLSYDGQWRAGRPHGRGRLVLPNGEEYEGEFRDGFAEGMGRYTETTWERFEGTFSRGLRTGNGTTTLPSGLTYESHWVAGRETANSLKVRVAQLGAAPAVGGTDDVRMGITMGRRPKPLPKDLEPRNFLVYSSRRDTAGIVVVPDDPTLVATWIGNGEIRDRTHQMEPRAGLFEIDENYVQPATFNIDIQNKSSSNQEIVAIEVAVKDSHVENKPAIELYTNINEFCDPKPMSDFEILNFGWASADNVVLSAGFADKTNSQKILPKIYKIGKIEHYMKFDATQALRAARVDLEYLKEFGNSLECKNQGMDVCRKKIITKSVFGDITDVVEIKDSDIYVILSGTLSYDWVDHTGKTIQSNSPIRIDIRLGKLNSGLECGAAPPETARKDRVMLRLGAQDYTIPLPFRRMVPPGRSATFTLPLASEKSSRHNFEIVARLADGRQIKSPLINLLYFRPRPPKTN